MKILIQRIKNAIRNSIIMPFVRRFILPISNWVAFVLSEIKGNPAHDIFYSHGFHLLRKHFYLPIPDDSDVADGFWEKRSELVGVDMNESFAKKLLVDVFPNYMEEFRSKFPIYAPDDPRQFYLINGGYMAVDAHVYYGLIRHYKPRHIIEIGAGNSTILAGVACLQNESETGQSTDLSAIDPYPYDFLASGEVPGLTRMIKAKIQDVDVDLFKSLEANDILFIDSSHVLKSGGDVQMEYLEILPRLAPGVLVHIHDVSLPRAYPHVYYDNYLYWNEQYLLQAFLAFNSKFEVIWPGNYMMLNHPDLVLNVFPEFQIMRQHYPLSEPSAFWMRVRS